MLRAPRLALALALALASAAALACSSDDGASTSSTSAATASTTQASAATATASASETGSGSATDTATATASSSGGVPNNCDVNAIGEWNACKKGALIDNSLCNWTESATAGSITCLSPSSGGASVCAIEMCEDACDCFAPPATGDAVVECGAVLGGGGKACVLNCGGGETCPDGMECRAGYCYWPNN